MSILNFGTIRPAPIAEWLNSFVALPVFSYEGIPWKGASEIVTQFNYTATKNFTIRELPTPPANVNFCLVIRYRVGLTSYRYKLWAGVEEVLNENLYNGEVIKKNFVLEIWTTQNNTSVSLDEAINIKTSIRKIPDTYADLSEYADNTVVEEAASQYASPLGQTVIPTTGLLAHYKNEGINKVGSAVLSWTELIGGFNLSLTGVVNFEANAINGYGGAKFNGTGSLQGNSPFTSLGPTGTDLVFIALKQNTWVDGAAILTILDPNPTDTQGVQQKGESPLIKPLMRTTYSADGCSILPLGSFDVLRYIGNLTNPNATVDILNINQVNTGIVAGTTQGTQFKLGTANVTILEVACYDGSLVTDHDAIFTYFLAKFGLGLSLPISVNSENPWLSN